MTPSRRSRRTAFRCEHQPRADLLELRGVLDGWHARALQKGSSGDATDAAADDGDMGCAGG